ncbi:MAG: PAS domain S-box protein [Chloroflexota bacterium]
MPLNRNIARLITFLAGLILTLIVVIVPAGHFIVSYQYISGAVETEAFINSRIINEVISSDPEMWEFEEVRLLEYLSHGPDEAGSEIRRVLNSRNEVVAESDNELAPPVIMRSKALYDSGREVGRIEIYRSLNPLIRETALIALVMLPLGIGTFLILRYLPIRSIYQAERSLRNTNEFLIRVLGDTTDAIVVVDRSGSIMHVNRRASEVSGYPEEELVGRYYRTLFPEKMVNVVREQAEKVVSGGLDSFHLETEMVRKDGQLRSVSLGGSPLIRDGEITGIIISADDITERKYAEEALREARDRYQRVVEDLPDFICRFTPDLSLTFVNEECARRAGKRASELVGASYLFLMPPETHETIRNNISLLSSAMPVKTREHEVLLPNGQRGWHLWRDRALFDAAGRLIEVQSIGQDITERKRMEERLRTLSLTDELTGLHNRRGFFTMAEQQMKVAKRLGKGILLLSADLDGLKAINDTWGHQEGDIALIEAARIIRESVREADIAARIGGDEFVVLQMENQPVDSDLLASRVRKKIDTYNAMRDNNFTLSLSVGIVRFGPDSFYSISEMLDEADRQMYERKRLGRGDETETAG